MTCFPNEPLEFLYFGVAMLLGGIVWTFGAILTTRLLGK